jgi:hypothetical protein
MLDADLDAKRRASQGEAPLSRSPPKLRFTSHGAGASISDEAVSKLSYMSFAVDSCIGGLAAACPKHPPLDSFFAAIASQPSGNVPVVKRARLGPWTRSFATWKRVQSHARVCRFRHGFAAKQRMGGGTHQGCEDMRPSNSSSGSKAISRTVGTSSAVATIVVVSSGSITF